MNGDGAVSLGDDASMISAMSRACRDAYNGSVHVRGRYSLLAAVPDLSVLKGLRWRAAALGCGRRLCNGYCR